MDQRLDERRRLADVELARRVLLLESGQQALENGQQVIMAKIDAQGHKLAENTALTERVENNTAPLVKLAQQVEGTFNLLAKLSGVLRILLKTLIYGGLFIGVIGAGGYAMFHDGHLPEWFRSLIRLYKEVE